MGKNSKGGIAQRRAYHQADVAKEAAEEAKRAAKLAKKQENMKAMAAQEQESLAAASVAQAAPSAGGSMDVDRPRMSHKQKIGPKSKLGVRKGQGAIKKPNRLMKKTLKKLEKKREMEF